VVWTGRVSNPLGKLLEGALATEPRPGTALALMGGGHCFYQPARLGARSFTKAPHPVPLPPWGEVSILATVTK
jgi:hypothetical protein